MLVKVALTVALLVAAASGQEGAPKNPPVSSAELTTLSEMMWTLEQGPGGNAAKKGVDWTVDTRGKGKLFTKFNSTILKKPTYAALVKLLDNYEHPLGKAETVTPAELAEQTAFIDAVVATPVMQLAFNFLQNKKLVKPDIKDFKAFLQRIWFTIYKRRGQLDTSGFEHAFVGELTSDAPDAQTTGFHNWVQYALEEQKGAVSYERWKGDNQQVNQYGIQFSWNKAMKIKSTICIGESPEMSMAVLTVCFLYAPEAECQLRMANVPVSVVTYKWSTRDPNEFYVASAYYDA